MTLEGLNLTIGEFRFTALAQGPPDGDLVLFLHGFPQFADMWLPIFPATVSGGFRAVAIDQRGYSPTARPQAVQQYALEHLTADVAAFADALGRPRFHLVGHDWGGVVAWRFAAHHPERLLSVTVLSTPHPDALRAALKHTTAQKLRSSYIALFRAPGQAAERLLTSFNAKALRAGYQGKVPADQVDRNVERLLEPGALTAALNWYRALPLDLELRTGTVTVPTLFIWGKDDKFLGEDAAVATAQHVTGPYTFEPLQRRSHWLVEEATAEVSTLLLNHLNQRRTV